MVRIKVNAAHFHVWYEVEGDPFGLLINDISTKQSEVKGAITTADRLPIVLKNTLEEMNFSGDDEDAAGPAEGRAKAL